MDLQNTVKIFKALSNPNRLELYLKILEGHESEFKAGCGCFIVDIMHSLNIGAPTISHHVKELVNAGLITTEKKGKFLICHINKNALQEVGMLFLDKSQI